MHLQLHTFFSNLEVIVIVIVMEKKTRTNNFSVVKIQVILRNVVSVTLGHYILY